MAIYLFEHPETGEIREVYFKLEDKKEYFGEENEVKIKWYRRFTIPYAASNTKIADPFSKKDFMGATEGKNMTFGDMWDESARLSEQRAKINGEDPLKEQYYDKYASKRKGLKHLSDTRDKVEVAEKVMETSKSK
jgi:hypothetical protein